MPHAFLNCLLAIWGLTRSSVPKSVQIVTKNTVTSVWRTRGCAAQGREWGFVGSWSWVDPTAQRCWLSRPEDPGAATVSVLKRGPGFLLGWTTCFSRVGWSGGLCVHSK